MPALEKKIEELIKRLKVMGRVAIAYSGGIDSTLLLKIASDTVGQQNVLAVTADTEFVSSHEYKNSRINLENIGCEDVVIKRKVLEKCDGISKNPVNRCYLCKKYIFIGIIDSAKNRGFEKILDGTNFDDISGSIRPGIRALSELGVISPFADLKISKKEIRKWAKKIGLLNWDSPSSSCLATRIPYGTTLTNELLGSVEKAEDILRASGFKGSRVRVHGNIARIELREEDLLKIFLPENRKKIIDSLKKIGFSYVTIDLEGFRSGSMDI